MILVAPRQCQSSAPPGAEPKGLVLVLAVAVARAKKEWSARPRESISSCQCQHALAGRFRTPGRLCPIVAIEVRSVCAVESQTDIADVRISRIRRAGSAPTPALKITSTSFYYRGGGPGCACVRWLLRRSGALRKTASQAVPGKTKANAPVPLPRDQDATRRRVLGFHCRPGLEWMALIEQ